MLRPCTVPPPDGEPLCFPRYWRAWTEGKPFAGIGAFAGDTLVGLAVFTTFVPVDDGPRRSSLLSVAVRRGWRRQGIATRLVAASIDAVRDAGVMTLETSYGTGLPNVDAVARTLRATGWPEPVVFAFRIAGTPRGTAPACARARPARAAMRARGYSCEPWSSLTDGDRDQLAAIVARPAFPKAFAPLPIGDASDAELSVVIRAHGKVVGWVLATRQPDGSTVYYENGWVGEPYARLGWLLGAIFDIIERQGSIVGPDSFAVYSTADTNTGMHAFMQRRLGDVCTWSDARYRTTLTFAAGES